MNDDEFDVLMGRWLQRKIEESGRANQYPYGATLEIGYIMGRFGDSNMVLKVEPKYRPLTPEEQMERDAWRQYALSWIPNVGGIENITSGEEDNNG